MMSLEDVNTLSLTDFTARFGDIAEHAPWVAQRVAEERPFASVEAMVDAFQNVVREAAQGDQIALLKAHPDLAGRAARAGELTADSAHEQKGAGLDSLSEDEYARFHRLNEAYKARFEIPFIYAVKGATKHDILSAFEARLQATRSEEFLTALTQVLRIVRFRLRDRVS